MRKSILAIGIAIVVWIAWLVWPLTSLYRLVRAVEARNVAAIAEQIDAASIRRTLIDQIIEAYGRVTGAKINRNSILVGIASTAADPLVASVVTPDGVAVLLQTGWVSTELISRPGDAQGLSAQALGGAWQIFLNSHRGFDRYSISFPPNRPLRERFELEWRMRGPKFRLAAIRLPDRLVDQIVEQLAKGQRSR